VFAVGTGSNVYLIDASTGEEMSRIAHAGIVSNVSFSLDGKTLATASLKLIQLWDVSQFHPLKTDDLIQAACSRLLANFSKSEWQVLFGLEQPYVELCQGLPIPD
jgi:WD40 repeat protein